ncbi:hypothetical protein BGZ61DRAFT_10339 [Ilyonectria robusta]|uniref:uncharacterized protein n=1 Tax=Ilyonectria robusta TaxID=1079257 RepID=UPI001E8CA49B|nr:uncharacterized protein BGZ61DRAFT_10339 [Ilyonectria robusta]KAH8737167.1 hypothetical protein BGZ61DRAFT_10339 [Ilyonectria robusta]
MNPFSRGSKPPIEVESSLETQPFAATNSSQRRVINQSRSHFPILYQTKVSCSPSPSPVISLGPPPFNKDTTHVCSPNWPNHSQWQPFSWRQPFSEALFVYNWALTGAMNRLLSSPRPEQATKSPFLAAFDANISTQHASTHHRLQPSRLCTMTSIQHLFPPEMGTALG